MCFIAQPQAIKWIYRIMLFCITVPSFSSSLSIRSFKLLPPAVLSNLNESDSMCVVFWFQRVGGFVWLVLVGSFFIVLINKMATIPLDK